MRISTSQIIMESIQKLSLYQGIDPNKIEFFTNLDNLKEIASEAQVDRDCIEKYTEKTHGICIQNDEQTEVKFALSDFFTESVWEDTKNRLINRDIFRIALADRGRPEVIAGFLLCHEIGHWKMKHTKPKSKEEDELFEKEADEYALGVITQFFNLID